TAHRRRGADAPALQRGRRRRRLGRDATARGRTVRRGARADGRRSGGRRRAPADAAGRRVVAMRNLTLANQLTILRILIVPLFVLLVVYGQLGLALLSFMVAGLTDALDGLIARRAG